MSLFEPEETIGRYWHRLIGSSRSYRSYPDAAVTLESMRTRIGLLFRAFGGDGAIRIVAGAATHSGHRLSLKQAIGLGAETLERPTLDTSTLRLPAQIDLFPDAQDNEALYEWLAAWFAHATAPHHDSDPLRNDLHRLRAATQTTRAALAAWPGLAPIYTRLRTATLQVRPKRRLPAAEAEIEAAIIGLLSASTSDAAGILQAIVGDSEFGTLVAPRGYRTWLPVPMWGEITVDASSAPET